MTIPLVNPFSKTDNPIEELLALELAAVPAKTKRVRNAAESAERFTERLRVTLGDRPENWIRRRGVALMHQETQTLLGCFVEFTHTKLHSEAHPCTKLVRTEEPIEIAHTEWVSGEQWVDWRDEKLTAEVWSQTTPHVVDLWLPELGVRGLAVLVNVTCAHGGIMRVDLTENTQFHSDDRRSALSLPKGLNVLDVLGLDCKLAIRNEVGL